jgi:large subunit ribosomal protein L2
MPAILKRFEYDPNRRTLLALMFYYNGVCSYIIAVEGLRIGTIYMSGSRIRHKVGNSLPLKNIRIGTKINNLEFRPSQGAIFLRSCGVFGKLVRRIKKNCLVKLRSGSLKKINYFCIATVGKIMNFNYYLNRHKNAGFTRLQGFRPSVRGVAMNPVDHPHGGGEGKKSKKAICMSP